MARAFGVGVILVAAALSLSACGKPKPGPVVDAKGQDAIRVYIPHAEAGQKSIEEVWARPKGPGPWPALVLVHGHSQFRQHGASAHLDAGFFSYWVKRGFVVAALSQPGYGGSDGPPDFAGPFTQDAILTVVEFLKKKTIVKHDRIGLYGFGRGAIAAGVAAAREPTIAMAVLVGGIYDFGAFYPGPDSDIRWNIDAEAGSSRAAFDARSLVGQADEIKAAVLLVHGARDGITAVDQARRLERELKIKGVRVRLRVVAGAGHDVPIDARFAEMEPFLKQYLN